jgi:N-acetylmuramate 1-kinase
MDIRQQELDKWLQSQFAVKNSYQLTPLQGDASFRRYFRVKLERTSYIAMDAPPEREDCQPFVAIAKALLDKQLQVPEIIASNIEQGFLLLSDFGDKLYLKELNAANAEKLYQYALESLAILQSVRHVPNRNIPLFSADFMRQELQLSQEWFLEKHLGLDLNSETVNRLADFYDFLAITAASQPQVFMHRDYHSANLMLLPQDKVGILDFQDAFIGPVTYDLVSLLRDCYIAWPDEKIKGWALQYLAKLPELKHVSAQQFLRWFDLMGMQRHLKALLTFARKFHRDNDANYLKHMPLTLNYLQTVSRHYSEAAFFQHFLDHTILPAMKKVAMSCVQ